MSSGTDISKGLTELWLCKEISRSTLVSLGGRDKGASCLQPNPETFYILREKQGRRGTNKERKGKLEREREKRKKEGLKQNTNPTFGESR